MPNDLHLTLPRRQLLQSLLALGAWPALAFGSQDTTQTVATSAYPISARGQKDTKISTNGRLVVVFLRGATMACRPWCLTPTPTITSCAHLSP